MPPGDVSAAAGAADQRSAPLPHLQVGWRFSPVAPSPDRASYRTPSQAQAEGGVARQLEAGFDGVAGGPGGMPPSPATSRASTRIVGFDCSTPTSAAAGGAGGSPSWHDGAASGGANGAAGAGAGVAAGANGGAGSGNGSSSSTPRRQVLLAGLLHQVLRGSGVGTPSCGSSASTPLAAGRAATPHLAPQQQQQASQQAAPCLSAPLPSIAGSIPSSCLPFDQAAVADQHATLAPAAAGASDVFDIPRAAERPLRHVVVPPLALTPLPLLPEEPLAPAHEGAAPPPLQRHKSAGSIAPAPQDGGAGAAGVGALPNRPGTADAAAARTPSRLSMVGWPSGAVFNAAGPGPASGGGASLTSDTVVADVPAACGVLAAAAQAQHTPELTADPSAAEPMAVVGVAVHCTVAAGAEAVEDQEPSQWQGRSDREQQEQPRLVQQPTLVEQQMEQPQMGGPQHERFIRRRQGDQQQHKPSTKTQQRSQPLRHDCQGGAAEQQDDGQQQRARDQLHQAPESNGQQRLADRRAQQQQQRQDSATPLLHSASNTSSQMGRSGSWASLAGSDAAAPPLQPASSSGSHARSRVPSMDVGAAVTAVLSRVESELHEVLTASGRRAAPYVPVRGMTRNAAATLRNIQQQRPRTTPRDDDARDADGATAAGASAEPEEAEWEVAVGLEHAPEDAASLASLSIGAPEDQRTPRSMTPRSLANTPRAAGEVVGSDGGPSRPFGPWLPRRGGQLPHFGSRLGPELGGSSSSLAAMDTESEAEAAARRAELEARAEAEAEARWAAAQAAADARNARAEARALAKAEARKLAAEAEARAVVAATAAARRVFAEAAVRAAAGMVSPRNPEADAEARAVAAATAAARQAYASAIAEAEAAAASPPVPVKRGHSQTGGAAASPLGGAPQEGSSEGLKRDGSGALAPSKYRRVSAPPGAAGAAAPAGAAAAPAQAPAGPFDEAARAPSRTSRGPRAAPRRQQKDRRRRERPVGGGRDEEGAAAGSPVRALAPAAAVPGDVAGSRGRDDGAIGNARTSGAAAPSRWLAFWRSAIGAASKAPGQQRGQQQQQWGGADMDADGVPARDNGGRRGTASVGTASPAPSATSAASTPSLAPRRAASASPRSPLFGRAGWLPGGGPAVAARGPSPQGRGDAAPAFLQGGQQRAASPASPAINWGAAGAGSSAAPGQTAGLSLASQKRPERPWSGDGCGHQGALMAWDDSEPPMPFGASGRDAWAAREEDEINAGRGTGAGTGAAWPRVPRLPLCGVPGPGAVALGTSEDGDGSLVATVRQRRQALLQALQQPPQEHRRPPRSPWKSARPPPITGAATDAAAHAHAGSRLHNPPWPEGCSGTPSPARSATSGGAAGASPARGAASPGSVPSPSVVCPVRPPWMAGSPSPSRGDAGGVTGYATARSYGSSGDGGGGGSVASWGAWSSASAINRLESGLQWYGKDGHFFSQRRMRLYQRQQQQLREMQQRQLRGDQPEEDGAAGPARRAWLPQRLRGGLPRLAE